MPRSSDLFFCWVYLVVERWTEFFSYFFCSIPLYTYADLYLTPVSVEPETPSPSTSVDIPNPHTIPTTNLGRDALLSQPSFAPYTDDPEQGLGIEPPEPATMLQTQRLLMDEQDQHLDLLSHSIDRQHHISLQINEELDVHSDLLQELGTQLDRTEGRLGRVRRSLDKVARGVKNNGSVVAIGVLIFVLLILIIRFKT